MRRDKKVTLNKPSILADFRVLQTPKSYVSSKEGFSMKTKIGIILTILSLGFVPLAPLAIIATYFCHIRECFWEYVENKDADTLSKKQKIKVWLKSYFVTIVVTIPCVIIAMNLPYDSIYPKLFKNICQGCALINLYLPTRLFFIKKEIGKVTVENK